MIAFFAPLAVTPILISSTHTITNIALARLPDPVLSLAVFAVVKGFMNAVKASGMISDHISLSLIDDRDSYIVATRFIWSLCLVLFALVSIVAFTPVGGYLLSGVLGLRDPRAVEFGYRVFRITVFLPFVEILRNSNRGLLIAREKTYLVSISTVARVVLISGFAVWAISSQRMIGVDAASIIWVGGIGVEGLVVLISVFVAFGSPMRAASLIPTRNKRALTTRGVWMFFSPLAVMITLHAAFQPVLQTAIAWSPSDSTVALAAYGVAWGLVLNVVAPLQMLHNCPVVFSAVPGSPNWKKVRRFCAFVGFSSAAALFVFSASPAGLWVLREVIGVSNDIAVESRAALVAFSVFPALWGVREAYWGALLHTQRTSVIGGGKMLNMAAVVLCLLFFFGPAARVNPLSPAVTGVIALTIGEACETFFVYRRAVRRAV